MMRLRFMAAVCITGGMLTMTFVPWVAAASTVSTHAEAAALIDVASGRILYSKNGDKPMRIASLTKIMTAIVAIESGSLSDKVKVSLKAYGVEGSSIYLRLGEEMSLHHLLYGLMLRSGNDAAIAVAEHVGGSVEGFVRMMNEKAELIGLSNTHFRNPHGLDAEEHYSTANDLAILTAYALNQPVFRDIVKTPSILVPNPYEKWDHRWRNKNKMLYLYDGADGVKTGYTKLSKRCLVSSATRGGQQLAAVTLNDGDDWADHAKLLDFGFKLYPLQVIHPKGKPLAGTTLISPTTFAYPLTAEELGQITVDVQLVPEGSLSGKFGIKAIVLYKMGGVKIGRQLFYDEGDPLIRTLENAGVSRMNKFSHADMIIREDALSIMIRLFRALFTATDSYQFSP